MKHITRRFSDRIFFSTTLQDAESVTTANYCALDVSLFICTAPSISASIREQKTLSVSPLTVASSNLDTSKIKSFHMIDFKNLVNQLLVVR